MNTRHRHRWIVLLVGLAAIPARSAEPATAATAPAAERPKQDAAGNPIRYAKSGHVSNYDEAKVGQYVLPDPLVLNNGEPVRDAATWTKRRRPEIIKLYEDEIYGHIPKTAPPVTFETIVAGEPTLEGAAVRKHIVVHFGDKADGPAANLVINLPANAKGPVPVLLHLVFFAGLPGGRRPRTDIDSRTPGNAPRFVEVGPVAEILSRGYGYATLRYTEIEGDRAETSLSGVRKLALRAGQDEPAADEWGTIAAWAWGASRVLDYFERDPGIDARRVGLIGHSRLGKTVLWAGARDPRFAIVFSSCSGEMGAALSRRDYGETIDDMAANFPWQFAGNFHQKYIGRWNAMPVDAHMLIALLAPRPVFITGGTKDQWADPHGEFLAAVAAAPVYRLLGKKDLGVTEAPPLDQPLVSGDMGFHYHTGGHTITPTDWNAFLDFAERYLRPGR